MKRQELFDGSLSLELPAAFENAAARRPMPDNQEMFADYDAGSSVVVDILEMIDETSLCDALQEHADEVMLQADGCTFALTKQTIDVAVGPNDAVRSVAYGTAGPFAMALFRLPECTADILITIHNYSGDGLQVVQSFRISSYSLFKV